MFHQCLIRHRLGYLQEIFFQTDHRQLKLHQTWDQIQLKRGNKYNTNNECDCLIREIESIIEKEKPKEEIASNENIFSLLKMPTILDNEDFEIKQEIKKQKDDEINEEKDLTRLKDEVDAGEIPKEIEFYFDGKNQNLCLMCSQLGLYKDNEHFLDFLSLDIGSQIFRENMLSIHIATGNIFYDNYNTNESMYSFLLNQQVIHATLTFTKILFQII